MQKKKQTGQISTSGIGRRSFLKLATLSGAGLSLPGWALIPATRALAAQSGSIGYWHHLASDAEKAGLDQVVAAFNSAGDVTVNVELVPNADFMANFVTATQGGNPPDTTMVAMQRLPDMAAAGGLVDLTDRVNAWDRKEDFAQVFWDGVTFDGQIYAVPAFMLVYWMFYRVDHFEEAGITEFPQTWEEFQDVAVRLSDPTNGRYGFGMRGGAGGPVHILDVIESWNGPVLNEAGEASMDEQKTADAIRFYAELLTLHNAVPPSAASDGYQQISTAFKAGQVSMMPAHTGALADIQASLGNDPAVWMSAPTPAGPAGRVARILPINNGMGSSDQADASWAWLAHWGNPEPQLTFNAATGYFPTLTAALEDDQISDNPYNAAAIASAPDYRLQPNFLGTSFWFDQVIGPTFQQVLIGEIEPEQAAQLIIEGLNEALSDA